MIALLLLALADPDAGFKDVKLDDAFARYLRGNPLLMEVAGAKVVRRKDGRRVVLGVGSAVLSDETARARLDAEKVCKNKALAAIVSEREGVQVAHEEKVEDRTEIVLDDKGEKANSVSKVLSVTKSKAAGLVKGMTVVGRWRSKDGKVLYVAVGAVCDDKGDPVVGEER